MKVVFRISLMFLAFCITLFGCARLGGGVTLLVRRRKPFFYFMPGYPGASRAFAIRKLLIAAACDTRIRVSQAGLAPIRGTDHTVNTTRVYLVSAPTSP